MNNHSERAHALLSASSSARWLACPPSANAAQLYEDKETEFTKEGTLAHEVAETIANGVTDALLADMKSPQSGIPHEMIDHAKSYADYIREHIKSDDAHVLLERRVDFSPWVPDGFGTCDCIILQGDTMTVIDYKYGQGVSVDAEGNTQLRLYALGALNDYGLAYDVAKVEMHIFQPRLNNMSVDTITVEELLAWAETTVKPTAELAAAGKGQFNAGDHCRFCPHAGACVELAARCTALMPSYGGPETVPTLSASAVAEILAWVPRINAWIKAVSDKALTDMLDGREIPGYKLVTGREGNRKWTDELQAAQALQAAGYSKEDITETKLLSPAGMDKALGKKKVEELLTQFISRSPGAPTVVPASDKRPVYARLAEAQKDFE